MYDILELNNKSLEELYAIAEKLKISKVKSFSQQDLIYKILDEQAIQGIDKPIQRKQRARIISQKQKTSYVSDNNTKPNEVHFKETPAEVDKVETKNIESTKTSADSVKESDVKINSNEKQQNRTKKLKRREM
jgi:Rho termination factor, N-terminal domain.